MTLAGPVPAVNATSMLRLPIRQPLGFFAFTALAIAAAGWWLGKPVALPPSPLLAGERSEEHTSELQSHVNLVCRLLLEKQKKNTSRRLPQLTTRTKYCRVHDKNLQ